MESATVTLITAVVGAVCGVTGAVLGILNTWHAMRRTKLRLKVTPHHAIAADPDINFGVEVINLSEFPVTVSDVGLLLRDDRRATFMNSPGNPLPQRLEPRSRCAKHVHLTDDVVNLAEVLCAYAHTECGHTIKGTSPALEQRIRESGNHGR